MNLVMIGLAQRKPLLSISGAQYRVSGLLEHGGCQLAHLRIVFNHQNRLVPILNCGGRLLSVNRFRRPIHSREVDLERRTLAKFAVHPDEATTLLYYSVYSREPQARSFTDFFRGKERLKNASLCCRVHAVSCVTDSEHNVAARFKRAMVPSVKLVQLHISGFQHESSALRHGITTI